MHQPVTPAALEICAPPQALPAAAAPVMSLLTQASRPRVRALRVSLLLLATVLTGVIDLLLTLNYVTSIGMIELNPLARLLMKYDGPSGIVLWKLLTLSLAVGILFRARHRRFAEVAAWCCFLVSIALALRWGWFVVSVTHMAQDYQNSVMVGDPRYVMIVD